MDNFIKTCDIPSELIKQGVLFAGLWYENGKFVFGKPDSEAIKGVLDKAQGSKKEEEQESKCGECSLCELCKFLLADSLWRGFFNEQ